MFKDEAWSPADLDIPDMPSGSGVNALPRQMAAADVGRSVSVSGGTASVTIATVAVITVTTIAVVTAVAVVTVVGVIRIVPIVIIIPVEPIA